MANSNAPRGLSPVRFKNGRPYNGAVTRYFVPASDGTALYIGDPVILAGSADSRGVPTVTIATAAGGAYVTGAIVGFDPNPDNLTLTYRPASTARYVMVADDPDLVFEIQEDSVGGALAATNVGQNADLIAGAGSTATGQSGWQLDSSTANTTNTLQLRIVELTNREDNEIGVNAKWLVMLNLSSQRNLTGI